MQSIYVLRKIYIRQRLHAPNDPLLIRVRHEIDYASSSSLFSISTIDDRSIENVYIAREVG